MQDADAAVVVKKSWYRQRVYLNKYETYVVGYTNISRITKMLPWQARPIAWVVRGHQYYAKRLHRSDRCLWVDVVPHQSLYRFGWHTGSRCR